MGCSVHAEGSYKHLMPGNPDFKKGASSVFSHQAVSSKAPLAGGEVKASVSEGRKGTRKGFPPPSRTHPSLPLVFPRLVSSLLGDQTSASPSL